MFVLGNKNAPILVLCDPPSLQANQISSVMSKDALNYFGSVAENLGFQKSDFAFLNVCPYMDDATWSSASRQGKFLEQYKEQFVQSILQTTPRLIVTVGSLAARAIAGKSVKITKSRGIFNYYKNVTAPVIHLYSPSYVQRSPQNEVVFESDFRMIRQAVDKGYRTDGLGRSSEDQLDYQWCTDLTEWINDKPAAMSFDTEGTGLQWYKPEVFPFTVQLCREPGKAICIPVQPFYYPEMERDHNRLMAQLKILLEDEKIGKAAHNIKYDYHMVRKLGITTEGWSVDTMLALFAVNENLKSKSLAEGTRLFIPELGGYSDEFDATVDKSKMIEVPHDDLLMYASADADACFRLAKVLMKELRKDKKQYHLFKTIQMPGLRAFADTLEMNGVEVDEAALLDLGVSLEKTKNDQYAELISMVPAAIKQKHIQEYKKGKKPEEALRFSRKDFLIDALFTKEGFGLTPKIFSKVDKKPSTSIKDHLPYFKEVPFVEKLIEHQKLTKILSTYVGVPDDGKGNPTGFWQYIHNGKIHPTYNLHVTVTGRSASSDPNGQNIPKRGTFVKAYRKIFKAPEGWTLVQSDYSQAELRIAAWEAEEPEMMRAYMNDEDIHNLTASNVLRMSMAQFLALPEEEMELHRFRGKGCNFGLLYLMSAMGYKEYAYTSYGVSLTEKEAKTDVARHYEFYGGLPKWHEKKIKQAKRDGFIHSLHGARRLLPDLYSTDRGVAAMAERQAVNSGVQRLGSDLGVGCLVRINRDLKRNLDIPIRGKMFVHDSNVFAVRDDYVEEALPYIKFYMESNPLKKWFDIECPIPITSDIEVGKNLGELKKRKDVIAKAPDWFLGD